MTAWVRFNNGGNTGFGTLIGEAVAVFEGDMFGIATPTGEGVTNPRTFTRVRRCVMVDNLRIY